MSASSSIRNATIYAYIINMKMLVLTHITVISFKKTPMKTLLTHYVTTHTLVPFYNKYLGIKIHCWALLAQLNFLFHL